MPSPHSPPGSESGVHATGPQRLGGPRGVKPCLAPLLAAALARALVALAALQDGGLRALAHRWDAEHFLRVALHGYSRLEDAAFAPLFPALVRLLHLLGLPAWAAGLAAANAAGLALVVLLCRLYGPGPAAALALLPSMALYTTAPYSEPLALALAAAGLLEARRRRWPLAGLLLGLASLARYQVAIPALALALAAWRAERRPRAALLVAAGPLAAGLAVALLYWRVYGDPLVYLRAERLWDSGLTLPVVGQVRWLLDSWFTRQPWSLGGHLVEPWMWAARNLAVYALYLAGLAALARRGDALEAAWAGAALLLVASLRGVPGASAPRLALEAFPAVAALAGALDRAALLALAGAEAALIPWVALCHLQAFYA